MSTYTAAEFATRVLKDLGLVGSTETPSAVDLAWAKETAISEIQMMADLGLPIWNGSELDIPASYLTTLSRRVGLALAPSYGMMSLADAQMAMREAERALTLLARPMNSPRMLKTNLPANGTSFNYAIGR